MESTDPQPQDGEAPALGAQETAEPTETSIPKQRLDQEIAKRKASDEALAQARKELEALKKQGQPAPADGGQAAPSALDSIKREIAELKAADARKGLQSDLGLSTAEQAKVVHELMQSSGLKATEALTIAQARHPDLFGSNDQRGFQAGQHASLRPNGGGPPQADTWKERIAKVATMANGFERKEGTEKLVGEMAKRALKL